MRPVRDIANEIRFKISRQLLEDTEAPLGQIARPPSTTLKRAPLRGLPVPCPSISRRSGPESCA